MNLDTVIHQIRTMVPAFGGRVGGAVDYFRARDQGWMDLDAGPAAYVIPLGDLPSEQRDQTDYYQTFTERVAIVVVLSNAAAVAAGDRRGQAASQQFDPLKWGLFRALLNWRPNSSIDNPGVVTDAMPGADRAARGLYYLQGVALEPDLARSFFQFDFGLDVTVAGDDAWFLGADPLEGVDIFIVDDFYVGEPVGEALETILAGERIDLQA